MGNNEPAVDQSDFRIRGSYGLNILQIAMLVLSPSVRTEYRKESAHQEVVLGHINVCDLIVTVSIIMCIVSPGTDIIFPDGV